MEFTYDSTTTVNGGCRPQLGDSGSIFGAKVASQKLAQKHAISDRSFFRRFLHCAPAGRPQSSGSCSRLSHRRIDARSRM